MLSRAQAARDTKTAEPLSRLSQEEGSFKNNISLWAKGAIPQRKKRELLLCQCFLTIPSPPAGVTLCVLLVLLTLKPRRQLMGAGWRESLLAVVISL